jgi:hypothetical protein
MTSSTLAVYRVSEVLRETNTVLCLYDRWLCCESQAPVKHKGKLLPCSLFRVTIVIIVALSDVLLIGGDHGVP